VETLREERQVRRSSGEAAIGKLPFNIKQNVFPGKTHGGGNDRHAPVLK